MRLEVPPVLAVLFITKDSFVMKLSYSNSGTLLLALMHR